MMISRNEHVSLRAAPLHQHGLHHTDPELTQITCHTTTYTERHRCYTNSVINSWIPTPPRTTAFASRFGFPWASSCSKPIHATYVCIYSYILHGVGQEGWMQIANSTVPIMWGYEVWSGDYLAGWLRARPYN
jgi:hypothetical protein